MIEFIQDPIVYKCAQTNLWINSPGSQLNRCIADASANNGLDIALSLLCAVAVAYFCFVWLPKGGAR